MQQLLSLTWRNGNNQEFTSRQRTFYNHSPLAYKHTTTRKMVQAQHHLKKRPRTPNTVAQNGGKYLLQPMSVYMLQDACPINGLHAAYTGYQSMF